MIETFRVLINMGTLHRLFPAWLLGLAVFFLAFSPWFVLALIYGVTLQFLTEYVMHRFMYHREPPTDQGTFNELYRAHISHHEFPNDAEFFTGGDHWYAIRFLLVSFIAHTVVLWPLFGLSAAAAFTAVALCLGSISAFTFYEYCHTLAHLKVKKGWFGQRVTRSHLVHHFQDHDATFHVSFGMGWIDALFGTGFDQATAKERYDRETIMSLGMDPEDLRLVTARKAYGITKQSGGREV